MGVFWKAAGGILVGAVLAMTVNRQEKDLGLLLSMAVCCMVSVAAFTFLEPVLDFLKELEQLGNLQSGVLGTLLKITGIGITGELAGMVCQDSGNGSLARGMQLLSTGAMLYLSLPIFRTMLELVQQILGEL